MGDAGKVGNAPFMHILRQSTNPPVLELGESAYISEATSIRIFGGFKEKEKPTNGHCCGFALRGYPACPAKKPVVPSHENRGEI